MGDSQTALPPGTTLGRYVIERLLGEGGMGAVYAARHVDLGKRVAIKTLHMQYAVSTEVRARFVREGQSASRIRHPNVVDVYDVAVEDNLPYLVMELLEGEDLAHLLRREGPLHPQRLADIMLPAIAAVAAANDLGIVHRDLKPENVFLAIERNAIKPKVVDFGISKVVDQENANALTGTSALLGTPYYMSPEQAVGAKHLDHRTDQYSLGVILYECVTARKPIEDATLYALMHKIVTGDFPPPRGINPAVPEELERVILRAMAKDAAQRFASTRELGRALLPLASERQRALYAEELLGDPAAQVSSVQGEYPSGAVPAITAGPSTTTLGQSATQRDVSPGVSGRSPIIWIALPVVALGAAAVFFATRSGGDAPVSSASGAEQAAISPPVNGSANTAPPVPDPTAVPAPANDGASPLASSSASPPPPPSAAASSTSKPPTRPVVRPQAGRPGLAPR